MRLLDILLLNLIVYPTLWYVFILRAKSVRLNSTLVVILLHTPLVIQVLSNILKLILLVVFIIPLMLMYKLNLNLQLILTEMVLLLELLVVGFIL